VFAEFGDAPARQKEIPATIARDKARHGRVIVHAQPHDDIFNRRHALAVQIAYRTIQYLREIEHFRFDAQALFC
jgi:hypothetical protein